MDRVSFEMNPLLLDFPAGDAMIGSLIGDDGLDELSQKRGSNFGYLTKAQGLMGFADIFNSEKGRGWWKWGLGNKAKLDVSFKVIKGEWKMQNDIVWKRLRFELTQEERSRIFRDVQYARSKAQSKGIAIALILWHGEGIPLRKLFALSLTDHFESASTSLSRKVEVKKDRIKLTDP
jgi:hypothetical protein